MNKKLTKEDFRTEAEKCARDIIDWMIEHELWIDTCIYVGGKRISCFDGEHHQYDNTWDCVFVEDNMDPARYFEWVGDRFLCMSFEGPLYEILNYYLPFPDYNDKMIEEFNAILAKYGKYYELGNAWNLALYDC